MRFAAFLLECEDVREIREFFYVDVDRVRSLLAQIEDGVVEALKTQSTQTLEGGAQASIFGIGARGAYGREVANEEARSLQDLTFVAFEEAANEAGLITELDTTFTDPDVWQSGSVHPRLSAGQLIRIESDVQVLDGGLFRSRVARFEKMAEALVDITDAVPVVTNPKQRAQLVAKAKDAVMGIPAAQVEAIASFVEAFVGDSVSVRVLPCGRDHMEYAFSGALLGRKEYLQEEREHLFSRYGALTSRWTTVMQVAAVPSAGAQGESVDTSDIAADGEINRAMMERIAGELLGMMEQIGLVEGPRWPGVSVTPLGIYRLVPSDGP